MIESLGLFSVVSFILTVFHVYRTPVVKNILPFTAEHRCALSDVEIYHRFLS